MEQRRENGTGTIRGCKRAGYYVCTIMHNGRFYSARGDRPDSALFNAKQMIADVAEQAWFFSVLKRKRRNDVVYLRGELLTLDEYEKSGLMPDEVEAVMVKKSDVYKFGNVLVRKETVDNLLAKSMGVSVEEVKGA